MLPNLTKGRGIKGTALYVLHDERTLEEKAIGADFTPEHQTAQRVGMTATRNLSTDDPNLAWRLMCQTAKNRDALKQAAGVHKGGRGHKYECGHLSLSWDHGSTPNREEMLRAADGALKALGWEKAQALIVEHRDHEHAHCHIVVNLIDPETGKVLPNDKGNYDKLQAWAHDYDAGNGNIVCKDRAAKIERERAEEQARKQRTPDQQQTAKKEPAPKGKKWLSRAEWEAQRNAARTQTDEQRKAQQGERFNRYREAAQTVRDQFRDEWATHYKNQRQQERMLQRSQAATMRELNKAAAPRRAPTPTPYGKRARGMGDAQTNNLAGFYNSHAALVWEGIPADQRPASVAAILNKGALSRAIETAHAKQRAELAAAHETAKKEIGARHEAARIEAQRAAWKAPKQDSPQPDYSAAKGAREQVGSRPAEQAAHAQRTAKPQRTAEQDLQDSAERIRRRQRAPANESQYGHTTKTTEPRRAEDDRPKAADPRQDDLARYRAIAEAEAAKMARLREARQRQRHRGRAFPEREPGSD